MVIFLFFQPMPGHKLDMFSMQQKTTPPPAHMATPPTHGSSHHSYHQSPHRGASADQIGGTTPQSHQPQPQQPQAGQPVEFNHAINYVNKIKVGSILQVAQTRKLLRDLVVLSKKISDHVLSIGHSNTYMTVNEKWGSIEI